MELMILRRNRTENEYYAGFNRHEWLAFNGADEYIEFLQMIGVRNMGLFSIMPDNKDYAFAFIDLKTAKAVDKKFGFKGSFVRAYKLRTVQEK